MIKNIAIACIYASDFRQSFDFYHSVLELGEVEMMNEHSCYFTISEEQGVYLVGGFQPVDQNAEVVRTTVAFSVESTSALFERFRSIGIRCVQLQPEQMNESTWWFQCFDPSGNVIEFLGGA